MNHQPNWKPEAPAIPAKLREDGELEEIVRQAIADTAADETEAA